jgi:hypothetical protein
MYRNPATRDGLPEAFANPEIGQDFTSRILHCEPKKAAKTRTNIA